MKKKRHPESATFEKKFFASCQNSVRHFAVQKKKGRRRKYHARLSAQVPTSSVSKGCLVATKDRSGRAQCQAKKTGNIEKTIAKATVSMEGRSKNSALLRNV